MTASLKAIDGSADLPVLMNDLARSARAAARALAVAPTEQSIVFRWSKAVLMERWSLVALSNLTVLLCERALPD